MNKMLKAFQMEMNSSPFFVNMKQPIKGQGKIKRQRKRTIKKKEPFPQYGTSQLERDFAREFLDKNGIKYIYQFKAKGIGRYYDFAVVEEQNTQYLTEERDGLKSIKQNGNYAISFLIEVDGGWFHSDPRVIDKKKLNTMQKRNKIVDDLKDKWAALNGVPLLRVWEKDIRENPALVREKLSKMINIKKKKENKKKVH